MSDEPDLPDDVEAVLDGCVAVLEAWEQQAVIERTITTHHRPRSPDYDEVERDETVYVVASQVAEQADGECDAHVVALSTERVCVNWERAEAVINVREPGLPLAVRLFDSPGEDARQWTSDCNSAELELRYEIGSELDSRAGVRW